MVNQFLHIGNHLVLDQQHRFCLRLVSLATVLLLTCHLSAQPGVIASLQPERIETGDTTVLLILVSGLNAEPKEVDFGSWVSVFPVSNIISRSDWRRSGTQWTRRFTLIAFDSATLELPPLRVGVASGKPLETNALTLHVFPTSAGRELSDMASIRDIRREPESWMDYWPWAAGILAALMLLVWWLRKKQEKPHPKVVLHEIQPPPVSAAELALLKLSELQQRKLWEKGQVKEHYAELSLILRAFLESRYGIAALESTTTEIQRLLASTDFSPEARIDLKELLQKADLVKYAQSEPEVTVHEAVLEKAKDLVSPARIRTPESIKAPTKPLHKPKTKSGKYEP